MNFATTIIFSIFLVTVHGKNWHNSKSFGSRIVGGRTANNGDYPYMASLRIIRDHLCGGAILNDRWILTAAICADILPISSAYVGSNYVSKNGVSYSISEYFIHPDYKGYPTYANNIALLKLKDSIKFNNYVKSIPLPSSEIKDKQQAVFSGWGANKPGANIKDELQYFDVSLLTSETCQKEFPVILHESHFCAQGERYQGVCNGDVGSPLVADGAVVGVSSHLKGFDCAEGYPDFFTNGHQFLGWINKTMSEN